MKKSILYLLTILLFTACGGGDDAGGSAPSGGSEFLNVNNNNPQLDIPGGNTQATLNIQASQNCEWTITWNSSETWIKSINPTKARGSQNVSIQVTTNPSSSQSRSAILTISNGNNSITRTVNIVQSASSETLELSIYDLNMTYEAGNQDVRVTSNAKWSVTGMTDWLTVNPTSGDGDGKITISVLENLTEQSRPATLTFTGSGGASKQLKITQAGRPTDFSVSPTSLTAEAKSSKVQFNITGEARWTIKTDKEWARPSDIQGEGSKTIIVELDDNITENQQQAIITISSATNVSKFEQVTITQKAATRPVISDYVCTDITRNDVTVSFSFTSMYPVTEYGICYSTNENPTISDKHVLATGEDLRGSYSTKISGLTSGSKYWFRAYAKSVVGPTYSEPVEVETKQGDKPNAGDNPQPGW